MDPFLLSLAMAIATGVSTVAGKLIEKGVVEPALEPAAEKLKRKAQAGVKALEKDDALARALLAAIEDAARQKGESRAVQYARRLRLHALVEPGNEALRDEAMRLVYLASSDDPALVPAALLTALDLSTDQRPALARFLFYLRQRLYALPDFKTVLDAAHNSASKPRCRDWRARWTATRCACACWNPRGTPSRTCAIWRTSATSCPSL